MTDKEYMQQILRIDDRIDSIKLLTERYAQGKNWKEVADILGYSEARVRGELHDRALTEVGFIRSMM